MQKQTEKSLSKKPIIRKYEKKHSNPAFNFLCYCIYGINHKKAQTIINSFDLKTLTDLQKLTHEQLTQIEGIGPKTAKTIIEAIR